MPQHGVIGLLLPVAIFVELAGALLLIVGFRARFVALALAGFCVVTALLFHANFADRTQMFHFLKNVSHRRRPAGALRLGPGPHVVRRPGREPRIACRQSPRCT